MDVINYKGEKALLLDSDDLNNMIRPYTNQMIRNRNKMLLEVLDSARHNAIKHILIISSRYKLSHLPIQIRHQFDFIKMSCFRAKVGGS